MMDNKQSGLYQFVKCFNLCWSEHVWACVIHEPYNDDGVTIHNGME